MIAEIEYVPSLYAFDAGRQACDWPPRCSADGMLAGVEEYEDFEVAARIKLAALHRPAAIRLRQPGGGWWAGEVKAN